MKPRYKYGQHPFRLWEIGHTEFFPGTQTHQVPAAYARKLGQRDWKIFRTKFVIENGVGGTRIWRIA